MSRAQPPHRLFAQCPPGLERLLEQELRALGVRTGRRFRGGVEAEGRTRHLYVANRWSRLASRILLRVAHFPARSFDQLERRLSAVDWTPWIDERGVVVRATSSGSALYHTGALEERVRRLLGGGSLDGGAQRVHVRVHDDRVVVSVDSSGEPLHRRTWRRDVAKAPLRPTVAAALLVAAGFDGSGPLVDPFCGSGTVAIEAARLAAGTPPDPGRGFAFQRWPGFEPGTWASVNAPVEERPVPVIVASDRDRGAVAATVANATRAGVELEVGCRPLSALVVPEGAGWLVTNPPYGRRIGGGDVRDLHARLGQLSREKLAGWTVAVLTDDPAAAGHAGLGAEPVLRTENGGLAVTALVAGVGTDRAAERERST